MTESPEFPDLDHHPRCENTTPDGMGCNCGAYADARAAAFESEQIRAFGGHDHGSRAWCQEGCPMFGKNRPSSSVARSAETNRLAGLGTAIPDPERRATAVQGLIDRATGMCRICSRVITKLADHDGAAHDARGADMAGVPEPAMRRSQEADPVLTEAAKRDWKPGDVALAVCVGGDRVRAIMRHDGTWRLAESRHNLTPPHEFRPLVVIDPEDREQVKRLDDEMQRLLDDDTQPLHLGTADLMAAALRSLIALPKPDEPTGLGALVEDAQGHLWFRMAIENASYPGEVWQERYEDRDRWSKWTEIDVARVLGEGVIA